MRTIIRVASLNLKHGILNVKFLQLPAVTFQNRIEVVKAVFHCPLKVINNSHSFIVSLRLIHNDSQGGVFTLKVMLWTSKDTAGNVMVKTQTHKENRVNILHCCVLEVYCMCYFLPLTLLEFLQRLC